MRKIPIVTLPTNGDAPHSRRVSYSDCRPLPACYMAEYSVIGLMVADLARALDVLRGNGLAITEENFGAEMMVPDRNHLPELVRILMASGVYCTIGDIIDSIYQG